ncbi:hypothetical protein NHF50_00005, partial [Flavobacterium sp. NRK F10]|uniref:beta strand repeat-containing protein n=1 Tax=Flavobacterium sp. NRK F10 TaxID=2954931 RepID=UPI0035AF0303|nr:hypothetical protein [Flavobacterium sp. NRK F10]
MINSYTSVTSISTPACLPCDANCIHTITVTDVSSFSVGDKALIIQMKGASIATTNNASGGSITSINEAGNYEFFEIGAIAGNVITPRYALIRNYNVAGKVQIVRIPELNNANISATLTASPWNDATGTGGVVAISANTLTFNADIDVQGLGFTGVGMPFNGSPDNCSINPSAQMVLPNTNNSSYTRGEGISLFDPLTDRGRAPRANGGGSGVSGDSGGGGGSNYGAGGEGGKRWCDVSGLNAGGVGGFSMAPYLALDKVFLGGAGGPGFVTTSNPSSAANGGGIVIIFANDIIGNGFRINASGLSPVAVNPVGAPDGGGGGGAGGSIVIKSPSFTTNLNIDINGGDGQDLNTATHHGPGGGGGGGVFLYSLASLPTNVTLNANGGIGGEHTDNFRNDSQNGQVGGSISLYIPIENPNYSGNPDDDGVSTDCDLDDDNDGILDTEEYAAGLPYPLADADGDGVLNFLDPDLSGFIDVNSDGINDNYDADLDGVLNQFDIDSDNDGCYDVLEAGFSDPDNNGTLGSLPDTVDSNGQITGEGGYTGTNANVTTPGSASTISSAPANQTTSHGANATFTVVASGGSGITSYQWQESTDNGTTWTNIVNSGIYSGANTNTLTLTGVSTSMNGYDYQVIITETNFVCANVVSSSANLSITSVIAAIDDSGTVTSGASGGQAVSDVLTNDTLNGTPATLATITLTQVSTTNANVTLNPATGSVDVAAGTPAGTYTVVYQICEQLNPTNCDTASVSVTIGSSVIAAIDDSGTVTSGASGGQAVADVLTNDTLNGTPATLATITLTQVSTTNPNVTLNPATGSVDVAAGTPAGTYTVVYQICEQLNPTNCDTASVSVTVGSSVIAAIDDSGTVTSGASGGQAVADVLTNDTLNGTPATLATITLTQ